MSKIVLGLDLGLVIGGVTGYYFGQEMGCIAYSLIGGATGSYLAARKGQVSPQEYKFVVDTIARIAFCGAFYLSISLHFKNHCAITHGLTCSAVSVAHGIFLLLMGTAMLNLCYNIAQNWRALTHS